MKIRAVIDTNVIISALLFGGLPEKVLGLVISKKIELILSLVFGMKLKESF